MRSDTAKTAVIGTADAVSEIVFKSLTGGRIRVAYVNAKQEYSVNSITIVEYQAISIVKGKPNVVKNVLVEVGDMRRRVFSNCQMMMGN